MAASFAACQACDIFSTSFKPFGTVLCLVSMKLKIIIKLIYLACLFFVASYDWENESPLIDSDPAIESTDPTLAFFNA